MRKFITLIGSVLLLITIIAGCGSGGGGNNDGTNNDGDTSPGSISGTISQVDGTGIANATVSTIPATVTATTKSDGSYSFTNITPSNYVVSVIATNYCTFSVAAQVTSGSNTTKNIKLVSDAGLIDWFPLNGTMVSLKGKAPTNSDVIDAMPTPTTNHLGQANGAYLFDGTSDYIDYNSFISSPTELTFSVWAKHLSAQQPDVYVFHHNHGAHFGICFEYLSSPDRTSIPAAQIRVEDSTAPFGYSGYGTEGNNILNDWVNLTGVWKSDGMIQIYQNGTPKTANQYNRTGIYTGTASGIFGFTIGGIYGENLLFHGAIADIRIFNRVLTAAEIEALAQR
jgi:hypothetical protein